MRRSSAVTASLKGFKEPGTWVKESQFCNVSARLHSADSRWADEIRVKSKLVLLPSSAIKEAASCEELLVLYVGRNDIFHPTEYKPFLFFPVSIFFQRII